jgi:hypothetical protein
MEKRDGTDGMIVVSFAGCVRAVLYRLILDDWHCRVTKTGDSWNDGRPLPPPRSGYWNKEDAILAGVRMALREIEELRTSDAYTKRRGNAAREDSPSSTGGQESDGQQARA